MYFGLKPLMFLFKNRTDNMTSSAHNTLLAGEPRGSKKGDTRKRRKEQHNRNSDLENQSSDRTKTPIAKNSRQRTQQKLQP